MKFHMNPRILFPSLLIALLLVSACRDEPPFEQLERSRTYLNLLNANSQADRVDVFLRSFESDGILASDLRFMESWPAGGYASLVTTSGFDSLEKEPDTYLRMVARGTDEEVIPEEGFRLNPEVRSTVVLIDSVGKAKLVKTIDVFEAPGDTAANVRFMNLNYTVTSVSMRGGDTTLLVDRLNFLNYSSFNLMPPGTYNFEFISDQTSTVLTRLRDVEIVAGRTYNFYLSQDGGAPVAAVNNWIEITILTVDS